MNYEKLQLYMQDIDGEQWLMAWYVDKNGEEKIAKVCKFEKYERTHAPE